jgi:hypothetical protein
MGAPIQLKDDAGWRWSWNGWLSAPHEFLEVRPWTPIVVENKLCFCARDGDRWSVSCGDHLGPPLDDAYDLTECAGKHLYIARSRTAYFLVWGQLRTRDFDHQITYRINDYLPEVLKFSSWRASADPPLPADWRPL